MKIAYDRADDSLDIDHASRRLDLRELTLSEFPLDPPRPGAHRLLPPRPARILLDGASLRGPSVRAGSVRPGESGMRNPCRAPRGARSTMPSRIWLAAERRKPRDLPPCLARLQPPGQSRGHQLPPSKPSHGRAQTDTQRVSARSAAVVGVGRWDNRGLGLQQTPIPTSTEVDVHVVLRDCVGLEALADPTIGVTSAKSPK